MEEPSWCGSLPCFAYRTALLGEKLLAEERKNIIQGNKLKACIYVCMYVCRNADVNIVQKCDKWNKTKNNMLGGFNAFTVC